MQILFLLLFGIKWLATYGEDSTERPIVCLENFQDLFFPRFLFFEPVHPMAAILILDFQFVVDYLPGQLASRHSEPFGVRLGKCDRSDQNDGHYDGCEIVYQPHHRWPPK
jgi:hypothetical protein